MESGTLKKWSNSTNVPTTANYTYKRFHDLNVY